MNSQRMIPSILTVCVASLFANHTIAAEENVPLSSVRVVPGALVPPILGDPNRPRLYDNTDICTPNLHWLALGGRTPNPMSVRDWFTTTGGVVHGFDLYVVNGKTDMQGGEALEQPFRLEFYRGTNNMFRGQPIIENGSFRSLGSPSLASIPPFFEPTTGQPGLIRVSVDYDARTYNLVGIYEDPPGSGNVVELQLNPTDEDIGDREPIILPSGNVGVNVRLTRELSVCNGGDPKAGPLLAGGGSGNEDGMHIIAVTYGDDSGCSPEEFPLMCPNPAWEPFGEIPCENHADCEEVFGPGAFCEVDGFCEDLASVSCFGGDVCNLDLPHFGIALTLYTGPNEDKNGNNEIATAEIIELDPPSPCTSGLVTVNGFVGDNGQPIGAGPVRLFDCDADNDVDFADFWCFQLCFGEAPSSDCLIHDANLDDNVDLEDFAVFLECAADPDLPQCMGELPSVIDPLQDIDIFVVEGLTPGQVLSALLEGAASPTHGPLWDPYLRLFAEIGGGIEELAACDDYYRFNLDALMTVEVPQDVDTIYIAVSGSSNADYDPTDPTTIDSIPASEAGGYALTVAVTDPDCVVDPGGGAFDCYASKHEPDDSLADADARGPLGPPGFTIIYGSIGDGAFAELGQDVDIYRIELDGDPLPLTENTRSIVAQVKDVFGGGFPTAFDLAMALYDSDGELIATGDQVSTSGNLDQTRPQLAANVCGSTATECENPSPDPGVYYLAIFATDRQSFDEDGDPIFPAIPPTILNFPHGDGAACTESCDIRPLLGGRVNKPGPRIVGREPTNNNDPDNTSTNQCYRINISTSFSPLGLIGPPDPDEQSGPNGNDAILLAATVDIADRLADAPTVVRFLGNGHFGGSQGDVDFYHVPAGIGDLVSLNIADNVPTPDEGAVTDNRVRSYLALYDQDGCIFALHDYSLERHNPNINVGDSVSEEIAANVAGIVPDTTGHGNPLTDVYAMVGIDNGNLDPPENVPFDALHPGTTLSRRFETDAQTARSYDVAVTVLDPMESVDDALRMFAVPLRGIDALHTEPFLGDPTQGTCASYPPIVELLPQNGRLIELLEGGNFFSTCRSPLLPCGDPDGCPQGVSANPAIAFDGEHLFIAVERCASGAGSDCDTLKHGLFRMNPNLSPDDGGYLIGLGDIGNIGVPTNAVLSGMVELGGLLYAIESTTNRLRWWDKTQSPTSGEGGLTIDVTTLDVAFDDVDGDLGTDGEIIYVGCSLGGTSVGICRFTHDPETNLVSFVGMVDDPMTNTALDPGPRLGGLDVVSPDVMVTTDRNGPVVQHWNMAENGVRAFELPKGFVIVRQTIR